MRLSTHRSPVELVVVMAAVFVGSSGKRAIPYIVCEGEKLANNSVIRVSEGTTLTLNCEASLKADDGSEKTLASDYVWFDGKNSVLSHSQSLEVIHPEEGPGEYSCALSNDEVTRSHVSVNVTRPPQFTITRVPAFGIPVLEGMTVLLSCDIDTEAGMEPTSPIRWMRNEEKIKSEQNTVTIMSVGTEDIGWYRCFIDAGDERFSSVGYFLNVIPQSHSLSDAQTGGLGKTNKNIQHLAGSMIYEEGSSDCSCCSKRSKHLYAGPLLRLMNRTRVTIKHSSPELVLIAEICSNPKAHKILWLTPDGRAIRSGETVGNFHSRKTVVHPERVTCVTSHLDIDLRPSNGFLAKTQEGEYSVIAKNHHGISETHAVIRNAHHPSEAAQKIANSSVSNYTWKFPLIALSLFVVTL